MGILRHFDGKMYGWSLGVVKYHCEYYYFFLCDFEGENVPDI